MTEKSKEEAAICLEKLDELTQDILKHGTNGGDASFRHIVFTGLLKNQNIILLEKMEELLFKPKEEDLKKAIIIGILIHKNRFDAIIKYGESILNMPYLDESFNDMESLILVLDGLITLYHKNLIRKFPDAQPLLFKLLKITCNEKNTSTLTKKLIQKFSTSEIGKFEQVRKELCKWIEKEEVSNYGIAIIIDLLPGENND